MPYFAEKGAYIEHLQSLSLVDSRKNASYRRKHRRRRAAECLPSAQAPMVRDSTVCSFSRQTRWHWALSGALRDFPGISSQNRTRWRWASVLGEKAAPLETKATSTGGCQGWGCVIGTGAGGRAMRAPTAGLTLSVAEGDSFLRGGAKGARGGTGLTVANILCSASRCEWRFLFL